MSYVWRRAAACMHHRRSIGRRRRLWLCGEGGGGQTKDPQPFISRTTARRKVSHHQKWREICIYASFFCLMLMLMARSAGGPLDDGDAWSMVDGRRRRSSDLVNSTIISTLTPIINSAIMVIPDLSQADIALIGFGGSTPAPVRIFDVECILSSSSS